jgi:hypothetical protein
MRSSITGVALSLLVLGAAVRGGAIELRLEATKESYKRGEAVVVRALVVNPLAEAKTWYLKRAFWLIPYCEPMHGDLGLNVWVSGPDGVGLERTKRMMLVARMETHPSMFQALGPGELFGQEVALTGEGLWFDMSRIGVYSVSAILSAARPKEWYTTWLRTHQQNRDAEPHLKDLFTGPVVSPSLEVRVVE